MFLPPKERKHTRDKLWAKVFDWQSFPFITSLSGNFPTSGWVLYNACQMKLTQDIPKNTSISQYPKMKCEIKNYVTTTK